MNLAIEVMGYGFIVTTILSILAKVISNDKLYAWGINLGCMITGYGSTHMPKTMYEKIEDYLQNSFGVFFGGVTDGLNMDDPKYKAKFKPKKDVKR